MSGLKTLRLKKAKAPRLVQKYHDSITQFLEWKKAQPLGLNLGLNLQSSEYLHQGQFL